MDANNRPLYRLALGLFLITILAAAAGLRFYNINWDNGIFAHPDERSTVAFYAPTIKWPESLSTALDPRASTLNPFWDVNNQSRRSYTYGHFPLYLLVFVAHSLHDLAPLVSLLPVDMVPGLTQFLATSLSGHGYAQIGRTLMALADLFTVYLLFLIGRRLYGIWGGLLAAALSTFTVLQIQLAHFFAVDPISTTFTLLALYGAILMYDRQSTGAAVLTGAGIALAVASKFSALPVALAPVIAGYLVISRHRFLINPEQQETEGQTRPQHVALTYRMLKLAGLALIVAFIIFTLTSPFVLLDFENFKRAVLEEQGNMVSGIADMPFTRQYRNTLSYWYFLEQQLRWGMGWPLGLLAFSGLLWVIIKAGRGQAQPGEWIILGWIVLYFGPTGLFLAKFMRYMIPVVPLFTLFGAGLVIALWRYKHQKSWLPGLDKLTKPGAIIAAAIALTGSALWSLAFVNGVYGTEHTWVTFARWTYANVPDRSCIAYEHWDDRMPTDIPEPGGTATAHGYVQPILPMYDDDTGQKYELLRNTLINCDYIALASNRLWRTIPRLPERYPMSTRYYEALFSGELGFEPVYSAETPPRLGPFIFDDQAADESFTVYDHPNPIMFKKVRQLSQAEWDSLLGDTWQGAIPGYVGQPTLLMRLRGAGSPPGPTARPPETDNNKTLKLRTPVDELPVIDDFRWNTLANHSTWLAILFWWLVVVAIGLFAFPLTFLLLNKLPDRGYALSKSLGLLLISYFVWLNSSLKWLSNSLPTIILAVIILIGFNLWASVRYRHSLSQFWQGQKWFIVITEALFTLIFLFFVYLRLLNPDLWQPWLGGEKMLEIGFLNAIVKSAYMPPYDPFFAGGIINYYYYGLFLVNILIKLTGIQPAIAFNLAVPTLAALTAVNVFSLAGNLTTLKIPFKRLPPKTGPGAASKPESAPLPTSPWWGEEPGKLLTHQGEESRKLSTHQGKKPGEIPPQRRSNEYLKVIPSGLLAILFVVFIGNLEGAVQFLRELGRLSTLNFQSAIPGLQTAVLALDGLIQVVEGTTLATYNYWDPTRVIPATINEFPFFSFLFADLHPHMIGIPFTVLFLSLAYNWLQSENKTDDLLANPTSASPSTHQRLAQNDSISNTRHSSFLTYLFTSLSGIESSFTDHLLRWLALPFVLGALAIINTWDLPTYLGLMTATYLLGRYRRLQENLTIIHLLRLFLSGAFFGGALLAVTYLLYAPFFANYQALDVGLGLVHTQTSLGQHLKIWGLFIFIIASWAWVSLTYPATRKGLLRAISLNLRHWNVWPHLTEIYRKLVPRTTDSCRLAKWGTGLALLITIGLAVAGYHVPAYLLPLVMVTLLLLFRPEVTAETAYLGLLTFTGLLVLLGVEFFFLRDFLGGGDYYRMNTLFKFFSQVWVIFGVVIAVALPQLWQWAWHWPWPVQLVWRTTIMLLLVASLVYPVLGTRTRVEDRFPGEDNRPPIGTLDGLAYMKAGTFEWPAGYPIELKYDYEAIHWLQNNVQGTPIIAEAKIGYYREGGMRVAAYTGFPSILGGLHQNEQRYGSQISERDFLVSEFWATSDPLRTLQLIKELDIDYIYVGQIERVTYGEQVENKFEQLRTQGMLELVFQNEKTKIYKH